jgi:FkbM family methyltransferase
VPFVSFAQNGEDIVLRRALSRFGPGTYIDVGASDPVVDSVTKAFYDEGWTGINIEPMPGPYERLVAARPRDVNLNAALEDVEGESVYFSIGDANGLSTGMVDAAAAMRGDGWSVDEVPVSVTTLTRVCEQHVDGDIHFLKIDVEGKEVNVLRGADFTRFRPFVIVVEAVEPQQTADPMTGEPLPPHPTPATTHHEWEPVLLDAGYRFRLFDGLNRFYVAEERDDELGDVVAIPANVLDDAIASRWEAMSAAQVTGARDLDVLRVERDVAVADRDAMARTLSWRITQPLRAIRRILR